MDDSGDQKRKANSAYAMLGLVMLFWAGNSIVGRAVRFDVPPFTLAFVRWAGALALVSPFAWRALARDWPQIRRGWLPILALGLLGVGAFNALLYNGLRETTATNALLLQAAVPALVVVLDRAIFKARAHVLHILGVAVSTLGVLAIVARGEPADLLRLRFGNGDLLILCAVVAWSFYTVLLRLRPAIAPVSFVAATFAVGVAAMAPFALDEWLAGARIEWSGPVAAALVYVALLPSLAAYFMYNAATARLGAARAGQAITLMPLFGALLSVVLLGERLQAYHLAGMALILAGIVVSLLSLRAKVGAGAGGASRLEDRP